MVKKKIRGSIVLGVFIVMTILVVWLVQGGTKTNHAVKPLSNDEQKMAQIYADLYQVPLDTVLQIKTEQETWEKVNLQLDKERFAIPDSIKIEMNQEGYALADLYKAEELARQTGRNPLALIKAKGKTKEKKTWNKVLKELKLAIKSTEEKLGLTPKQIQDLEKKKYNEEERIKIALLCLNRRQTYEEVMKELAQGKSIKECEEEGYEIQ